MIKTFEKILSLYCSLASFYSVDCTGWHIVSGGRIDKDISLTLELNRAEKSFKAEIDCAMITVDISNNGCWLTVIEDKIEQYAIKNNIMIYENAEIVENYLSDIIGMSIIMHRIADRNSVDLKQTITMTGGILKADIAIDTVPVLVGEWPVTKENMTDLVECIDKVSNDLWHRCCEN